MIKERRKGVAIIKSKEGILLVSDNGYSYSLPGGGANRNESREQATIREVKEETDLDITSIKQIGDYVGKPFYTFSGRLTINNAKVFMATAQGIPRPRHEIREIAYWNKSSDIRLTKGTQILLNKYSKEIKQYGVK